MMETLSAQIARFFSIIAEREELHGRLERLAQAGEELVGRADAALYEAKRGGHDRAVVA